MEWGPQAERGFKALCKKYSVDPQVFDAKAYWDNTLEYGEAVHVLEDHIKKIGTPPPVEESAKEIAAQVREHERKEFRRIQEARQKSLEALFNGALERSGEADELLGEIQKFSPHSERIVLSTLLAVNQGVNVLNVSPAGLGKSRGTMDLLEMLGIPHTQVAGHQCPTALFATLRDAHGVVVVDESLSIFRNPEAMNMLLSALWTREISWNDEKARVDATIIFNANALPKTQFSAALADRCQYNTLRLSTDKVKAKIMSDFEYAPNKSVWEKIKNNAFVRVELTADEIGKLKETLRLSTPKSVREKGRLLAQARFCKAMFGSVDYVRAFVDLDKVATILESDLTRPEKCRAIAEVENVSLRTAQRMVLDAEG